jgi:dienelactone hydrolase
MEIAQPEALSGPWVGGITRQDSWVLVQAHLTLYGNGPQATLSFPLEGTLDLPARQVAVAAGSVSFIITKGGDDLMFRGHLHGESIVGTVTQRGGQSPFQLVRVASLEPAVPDHIIGTYEIEPGRYVFIGNMLGSSRVAYHDFATRRIGALFASPDGSYFAGPALLVPAPVALRLTFSHDDQSGTWLTWHESGRPPTTVLQVRLRQEAVHFASGTATLAGTVLLPSGDGPHPAVVLVHGSGPQTRHMVRLHAEYLARHGVAALIYDKRGVGASTGDWQAAAFEDLAADALAALRVLQAHPAIRADQVGLWGASQGGWIVPIAAAGCQDVAFAILVAGPAVSITQQNRHNVAYSMRADGFGEEDITAALAHLDLWSTVVRTGEGWTALQESLRQAQGQAWAAYAWSLDRPPSPDDAHAIREEMDRDPVPVLEHVTCPLLALFGASDTIVPPIENQHVLEAALRRGGNTDYTIAVLPKASHIFLEASTGAVREYAQTRRWVPEHVQVIVEWILRRVQLGG